MESSKILFCIENVRQGGISKALESLLPFIEQEHIDARIFCINQKDGPYANIFEKYFHKKQNKFLYLLSTYLSEHNGLKRVGLICVKAIYKLAKKVLKFDLFNTVLKKELGNAAKDDFDVVIAFAEGCITHACSQIKAKKKIAWIHLDYGRHLEYNNNIDEKDIYKNYDYIVIPSQHCCKSFLKVFPQYQSKVRVIPNLVDEQKIKALSTLEKDLDTRFSIDGNYRLVSVGRICYEKRFFEIPAIAKELKEQDIPFKWYIIGGGSEIETAYLMQQIALNGVEEQVILLGAKDNPYPYIRNSHLLAVTSLTETFCYAIAEAKTLNIPVITTNFGTAYEVVKPEHGIICDLKDFVRNIIRLYEDKEYYNQLRRKSHLTQESNRLCIFLKDVLNNKNN